MMIDVLQPLDYIMSSTERLLRINECFTCYGDK